MTQTKAAPRKAPTLIALGILALAGVSAPTSAAGETRIDPVSQPSVLDQSQDCWSLRAAQICENGGGQECREYEQHHWAQVRARAPASTRWEFLATAFLTFKITCGSTPDFVAISTSGWCEERSAASSLYCPPSYYSMEDDSMSKDQLAYPYYGGATGWFTPRAFAREVSDPLGTGLTGISVERSCAFNISTNLVWETNCGSTFWYHP